MKTNRIPFTLKDYESRKYKVVTKNGESVRIICTDRDSKCPIVAFVKYKDGVEGIYNYYPNGKIWMEQNSSNDLLLEETVFEDGDIIISEDGFTMIIKEECVSVISYYVLLRDDYVRYNESCLPSNTRLATEEEKIDFFSKLEKIGKKWNAEKKCIEDIKEECELKPFQKVLVRYTDNDAWKANMFSHFIDGTNYKYICIDSSYKQCIPYEGNEKLLGTINSPKQ